MKILILLCSLLFVSFGCLDISNPDMNKVGQADTPLGEEFLLRYQGEVTIAGTDLTIKFSSLPEDSRCPVDVVCVWEGNAHVVLLINNIDKADLNTALPSKEVSYKDTYKITLVEVQPLPFSQQPIPIENYKVKLKVEKLTP